MSPPSRMLTPTLLLAALTVLHLTYAQDCNPEDQIWDTLTPGPVGNLTWQTCYSTRLCAKLQVPLDYNKPNGTQAVVALLKVPAAVPTNDTNYRGPILFNPGGPGGSGVDTINGAGELMQGLFGTEYDIVGFDPRGVGRTTPAAASVFPTLPESLIRQLQDTDSPPPFITPDAIARLYDNSLIYGDIVNTRGQNYAPFVSTAITARDMLEITRAHGREKLQYWGTSYGSLLGTTYAALLPNNIERLIVDGVIDAEDYLSGAHAKNLLRTDAGLSAFYQACVDAGPTKCAIHESTVAQVSARVETILNNLKRRPIPVFANQTGDTATYGLVTYKIAQSFLFNFLYFPYPTFSPLIGSVNSTVAALALKSLEEGDGSLVWQAEFPSRVSLACNSTTFPLPPIISDGDASIAILCADEDLHDGSIEDLETYFEEQRNISRFADMWTSLSPSNCKGWKTQPAERFRGPFVANTSFPILLVGNVNDPVLPVSGAITMSKGFAGSAVLTQNSSGHCSIAAQSVCTATALRDYMRDGKLPAPGTVCEIESRFFDPPITANSTAGNSTVSKRGDADIAATWRALTSAIRVPKFGQF